MLRNPTTDLYACPACHALLTISDFITCPQCNQEYRQTAGFIDLTHPQNLIDEQARHREHFDDLSAGYDERMDRMFGNAETTFKRQMLTKLQLATGGKLLEVGVGTGRNLPLLGELYCDFELYGIDFSPGMLTGCLERATACNYPVELAVANAEYLPFAAESFDAVLHFGFINDFPDPKKAIDEMVRVAKSGACVVISDDGFPAASRRSQVASGLIDKNRSFGIDPPVKHLPEEAHPYQLQWFMGLFYIISFRKNTELTREDSDHG